MNEVIVGGILVAVGVAAGTLRSFLSGYGARKGENLATQEDIDRVTTRLEALQAQFSVAIQKAAASHSHRFELEVSIYRELWHAVLELQEASDEVWYQGMARREQQNAYDEFRRKLEDLQKAIRRASPFFPREMNGHLLMAQLPIRKISAELSQMNFSSPAEAKSYLEQNLPPVWASISGLEDAIRTRLWQEDVALDRLVGRTDNDDG